MRKVLVALTCVAALAACGGSDGTMNGTGLSAYDSAALQVSDSVTSYRNATTTMTSLGDCTAAVQHDAANVQPALTRLREMAGPMDDAMRSAGQMMGADMRCGVAVMQQAMEQHLAAACGSQDMTRNRTEAQQYADDMLHLAEHMRMRVAEMNAIGAGGAMMQGGISAQNGAALQSGMSSGNGGTQNGEPQNGMSPQNGGPQLPPGGWQMPDGGMMGWDDAIPGCAFVNGTYQQTTATGTDTAAGGTT